MEQKSKSKVLSKSIIAAGFIVATIMIIGPRRFFAPLRSGAVGVQFFLQMKPAVQANSIRVRGVEYHARGDFYLVKYTLYGGQTATQYAEAGCALSKYERGFVGSCVGGDFYAKNGKVQTKKIEVKVY